MNSKHNTTQICAKAEQFVCKPSVWSDWAPLSEVTAYLIQDVYAWCIINALLLYISTGIIKLIDVLLIYLINVSIYGFVF